MKVTTSSHIAGQNIVDTLGVVRGNTIRVRHLGRDILASLRMLIGGEIHDYTKIMGESREQAIDRMREEARSMGANAIVDVRFTTSYIMTGAAEILVYGTAVVTEEPE